MAADAGGTVVARLDRLLARLRERLRRLPAARRLRPAKPQPPVADPAIHDLVAGRSFAAADAGRLADGEARIAFVGCLPPYKTGVATSTYMQLLGFGPAFDLFVPIATPDAFLRQRQEFGGNRVLALDSLLPALAARRYDHVVFVIGNSEHFAAHLRLLPEAVKRAGADSVVCYLHDPFCTWVAQTALGLGYRDMEALMSTLYGREIPKTVRPSSSSLFDAKMYGPRLYCERFGVRRFLVNSKAAAAMVRGDLRDGQAADIETLFLPVDEDLPVPARDPIDGPLVVGSFGVPTPAKLTGTVIEAVGILNRRGRPTRLQIAGFHAREWVRTTLADRPEWLDVAEPETEADLRDAMRQCDVAVQLRAFSQGETSGIVTSLMGLGIPTIVSPVGAFVEFGRAVVPFSGTAHDLADLLQGPLPPDLRTAMRDYASAHSLQRCRLRLAEILPPRDLSAADAMPGGRPA